MSSLLPVTIADAGARKSLAKLSPVIEATELIKIQLNSFRWFQREGLKELFQEISPIKDFTGSRLELNFRDHKFREPKYTEDQCRQLDLTYSTPLYVNIMLSGKEKPEPIEQFIFLGDFPQMTESGTFIINGAERVVVSQLMRSPGVYFTVEKDITTGREFCYAKLIPDHGAWLEFETNNRGLISVRVDGKRRIPVTTLLRAIGFSSDEQLLELFTDLDGSAIQATIEKESMVESDKAPPHRVSNEAEALQDIYRRLWPGDPPNIDNARTLINNLFFNSRRYDLGRVGRYKLNKRLYEGGEDLKKLKLESLPSGRVLTPQDLVAIVRRIILINNGKVGPDDIDHLGNRRLRTVGELIQNQFRIGLLRLERIVKERMSILAPDMATPSALINIRPVVAAMREFFGSSQLSQFMDQTNPLAELTHKRRLSALGPGGLSRERAGFDVRDVHYTHYGRICPIETPEGPNIGLIGSLATYSIVNEYGFIEAPYRKVIHELPNTAPSLVGQTLGQDIPSEKGRPMARAGDEVSAKLAEKIARLPEQPIKVVPFASNDIAYLSADKEELYAVAQANARLDEKGHFIDDRAEVRIGNKFSKETPDKIDFIDVSPKQVVSVATSLIPFLEHDDANRALMGSNMQRQAVPLLRSESPLVGTGMERQVAKDSGQVIFAKERTGVIDSVTSKAIIISGELEYAIPNDYEVVVSEGDHVTSGQQLARSADGGEQVVCQQKEGDVIESNPGLVVIRGVSDPDRNYRLMKFMRTNQGTCINQRPIVSQGDSIVKGQALADSSAIEHGELALGQNVLCAFMCWEGYNFEDAVIISENLVKEDKFTSIHIERYEVEARDTKLGEEEITRDIPNVGEESLRNLDEKGVIRVGAEVDSRDILVGKITPKGETELTAEEKLLRAIFGEKAHEVKDTSLRVPHGERGTVIDVKTFSHDSEHELPPGVNQTVKVWVAQKRKISEGDKLAGRHGNKGVIARILPEEDMPYLPDGTPVDIILNPIGVPSRMNIGQVLETHLGWAAQTLGFKVASPVFEGASDLDIEDALCRAWIVRESGAVAALDGDNHRNVAADVANAKEWLAKKGYDGDKIFSDEETGEATRVCLRLWLEQQGTPVADVADDQLRQVVEKASIENGTTPPSFGKTKLYDGRTGLSFDQPITVGFIYMMKLIHLVEDKVHARSTGPYSLITQQPLGGKAQFGGQRFGEMEVWALEAYGAATILQELLTIKSDDVTGRAKAYESIIKGEDIFPPGLPESFKVLVKELQSLGLAVEALNEEQEKISFGGELEEKKLPQSNLLARLD